VVRSQCLGQRVVIDPRDGDYAENVFVARADALVSARQLIEPIRERYAEVVV
jgi:hypothetical protein